MFSFSHYLEDFSHLIFPLSCPGCNVALDSEDEVICTACMNDLPLTKYWKRMDNPVEKLFWGKIKIERASSMAFFKKGNKVQKLMHELKYNGAEEVGYILGNRFGECLSDSDLSNVDVIAPVPLHHSKLKKRGYNQCDSIVEGLAEVMQKPVVHQAVRRLKYNESQTRKGVYDRWLNVRELFRVETPECFQHQHVLLVDDVVTTGSTLEACAGAILSVPGAKVSIAALASPAPY